MKLNVSPATIICQNPTSPHSYFAWPSIARLQDGRLAMVTSGFRLRHICPFGKGVISYSSDEGQSWTNPTPIIDTPLDDRDCGICTFGEKGVFVSCFNNSTEFQRKFTKEDTPVSAYINSYLDLVDQSGKADAYLGSTFVISQDGGNTFGDVQIAPVSSPHGPCLLPDGNLLYVGRTFSPVDAPTKLESHLIRPDGSHEKLGDITGIPEELLGCEPHALVLKSGKVIVQIRVQGDGVFTIYQCESDDYGKTFTKPYQILSDLGGAPPHLLELSDGTLISTYGVRKAPYGIQVMFSKDEGKTWDVGHSLYENSYTPDLGYPASVELNDGRILTIFYAHPTADAPAVIMQVIWKIND